MPPLVSIITPSYNQANFLPETIESVLSQDYPNIEYIIVDGGSNDDSVEIIQQYSGKLSWWVSEPDQGQTDAINKGFAHASGEILAWLNSDDTYQPGAIHQAVETLLAHPEVAMVYGDANLINEYGNIIGRFPARQTDLQKLLRGFVHIPQQTTFFPARVWLQVGPLDPTIHFAMDYDLWVRMAKLAPLLYVPLLWANFRLHGEGKSVYLDERCYPEMIKISRREGAKKVSGLILRWYLRRLTYAWLPIRLRVKLRQVFNI
jgi:glycosyltransferase involved in cell wall biosynthesis